MTPIYFIYGLSFFSLGLALVVSPKEGGLGKNAHFLAAFALLHAVSEWIDMSMGIDPGLRLS